MDTVGSASAILGGSGSIDATLIGGAGESSDGERQSRGSGYRALRHAAAGTGATFE